MCFYLTTTLPKGTEIQSLRPIVDQYDMAFDPLTNPHLSSQLPPGELYFRATKGHCDCGTVLGALSTSPKLESLLQSKKARKLRKKGWTDEQIEQWAMAKLKNAKQTHGRKHSPVEIEQETSRWINFFRALLQTGRLAHIGLLKHWYKGSLDTEELIINAIKKISIDEVTVEVLTHLDEDILYQFHPE